MKKEFIFILLLMVSLFFIYQKTLNYDLIWDTKLFINESYLLNNDVPILSVFKYGYMYGQLGMQEQDFYYRPVLNLSFMIEKKIWGLRNVSLRLTNMVIFLMGILFLFLFLKRQREDVRFPATVTLLFALSPFNIDNIVWVVGRGDLFLFLWGVLTFLFFELFIEKKKAIYMVVSILFYTLGIFSKETFIFFWPVLIAYELLRTKKLSWFYHLYNALVVIVFFIIKNLILGIGNLHLVIVPSIFDYIKTGFSVFGYYCRILIFPFHFDNFNFVHIVTTNYYFFLGIVFLFSVVFMAIFSRKDRKNLFLLVFVVFSLTPYIILAFSTLWPFQISSRYMMLPFLGIIWILSRYVCRLNIKLQNVIVVSLIILFGSAIITGTYRYRSEKDFWKDALKSHPESSFVLLQMGEVYYEEGDDFTSLQYFSEALKCPMAQTTAVGISLGLAKLFYQRSDYQKALAWLDRLQFKILPYYQFHIIKLKAQIFISQDHIDEAEKILKDGIRDFRERKEMFEILYNMYVGFLKWDRAKKLEKIIKQNFTPSFDLDTVKMENGFDHIPLEKKIDFYLKYKNYRRAIETINLLNLSGFSNLLLLAELYYRSGNSEEGRKIIGRALQENKGDYQIRNRIGFFYLKKMNRMEEAILSFQDSLQLNPDQPGIEKLLGYLLQEKAKLIKYVL